MADTCYFPPAHYLAGSFKGASLGLVMECDSQHGRRGAEGEFPFGEDTAYADLGRRIRRYRIKSMFPKSTHIADAEALIAACESPYAGTLIHPTRGQIMAACKHLHVIDRPEEEAGVTYIELEFVEGNDQSFGLASSLGALFGFGFGDLVSTVQDTFAARFDIDALAPYEVDDALAVTASAVSAIGAAFNGAVGFTTDRDIARIQHDLATVVTLRDTLARPVVAWQAISNGIAAVNRYGRTASARVDAQRDIINAASQPAAGSAATIRETVYSSTRILAAAYMALAALTDSTATSQELCTRYNAFVQVIREEMDAARAGCDNRLQMALNAFLADAQKVILDRVYNAPLVVKYTFPGGVFSQVAAHEIYADGRRFAEIEARNPSMPTYHIGPTVAAVRA